MAYEEPSKEVQESVELVQKRVKDKKVQQKLSLPTKSFDTEEERQKHSKLIGQLK